MESGLRDVLQPRRLNAVLGWTLVAALVLTALLDALDGDYLWAAFALVVALVMALPAAARRSPEVMLPVEVLALATLPVVVRALVAGETFGGRTLTGRVSTYLAVAAVALVVAVELDVFTPVRMTESFAVALVAVTTTATAGVWALVQWTLDVTLGTAFLLDGRPEAVVERALMLDFLAATLAGVAAGVLFSLYFRRRDGGYGRVPATDGG
ncbi:MAG: hypothetical protein ABEJ34_03850 [Haloferacaceae archaeon]